MVFTVSLLEKSKRFLYKLDKVNQERIIEKLRDLETNPELGKPMTARLAGLWSLRIGKYRALYKIIHNELVIMVLDLEHRDKVYN